jgi:hypothetical protein
MARKIKIAERTTDLPSARRQTSALNNDIARRQLRVFDLDHINCAMKSGGSP